MSLFTAVSLLRQNETSLMWGTRVRTLGCESLGVSTDPSIWCNEIVQRWSSALQGWTPDIVIFLSSDSLL